MNEEELQAEFGRLREEREAFCRTKLDFAVETRLSQAGAVNTTAVRALLDYEKLSLEDDRLVGLDEQLAALMEKEKWAFKQEPFPIPGAGNPPRGGFSGTKKSLPSGTVTF